jgi:NTP pyrophosphatase (non-canonical NTP hydrolase)
VAHERIQQALADPTWQERARRLHARIVCDKWRTYSPEDKRFLSLALCGETGELANLIKKDWRGDQIEREQIASELADIRIYLELLADAYTLDLDSQCSIKMVEVEQRWKERGL